jgi:hypothetical protein
MFSHFFEYFSEEYGPNHLVTFVDQESISYENFGSQVRKVVYFLAVQFYHRWSQFKPGSGNFFKRGKNPIIWTVIN